MRQATIMAVLAAALLCGCNRHNHSDKQIFRYNESAGIATLDPAFAKDQSIIWPCRQLYNGLVELSTHEERPDGIDGTTMEVLPSIAKRWEISPDGMTYRFILRDDVLFHNGRTVVAQDFEYSFGRIVDPDVASPGAWIFSCVEGFHADDDTTFTIRLKEPFAPFLSQLGMVYCSVVPREVVEHYGKDYRNHPCGTGPFQFQYWKEGVKLVLRKNDAYFERDSQGCPLPYLDAVAVTFIVDRQTVFHLPYFCGTCAHAAFFCKTHKAPSTVLRERNFCRPFPPIRRVGFIISVSFSHCSFLISFFLLLA